MKVNVILSPHFDDAVLNCWYFISSNNSLVANIFSGQPPNGTTSLWDRICGEADSFKMIEKRKTENNNALKISGNTNTQLFIGLLDRQYRDKNDSPSIKNLADTVERMTTKYSIYYAPLAISRIFRHPDHIVIRKLGIELIKRGRTVYFYPDYPYMSSPHKVRVYRLRNMKKLAEKEMSINFKIIVNRLDERQLKDKGLALKEYKSQYKVINFQTFGALRRLSKRNYELIFKPVL